MISGAGQGWVEKMSGKGFVAARGGPSCWVCWEPHARDCNGEQIASTPKVRDGYGRTDSTDPTCRHTLVRRSSNRLAESSPSQILGHARFRTQLESLRPSKILRSLPCHAHMHAPQIDAWAVGPRGCIPQVRMITTASERTPSGPGRAHGALERRRKVETQRVSYCAGIGTVPGMTH